MYIVINDLHCSWLRVVSTSLSACRVTNVMLRYLRLYYHFSRARDGLRLQQREKWIFGVVKPAYRQRRGFRWLQKFSSDAFVTKLWIGISIGYFAVFLPAYGALSSGKTYPPSLDKCFPLQPARLTAIYTSGASLVVKKCLVFASSCSRLLLAYVMGMTQISFGSACRFGRVICAHLVDICFFDEH